MVAFFGAGYRRRKKISKQLWLELLFSLFFWVEFPLFSWVADGCWFFVQI
jgi:hypothetical protein